MLKEAHYCHLYNLFTKSFYGIKLGFLHPKKMLVALKDHLKIQVTVSDQEVNIDMPDMEDIIFLWDQWIQHEERLAEMFLKSQYIQNPYVALKEHFKNRGWEIVHPG